MNHVEVIYAAGREVRAAILVQKRRETLWKALKMTPEEIDTAKRACKDVKPL